MNKLILEAIEIADTEESVATFIEKHGCDSVYLAELYEVITMDIKRCPNCGSKYFYKAGKLKNRTQRYKCHNCSKTFSRYSNTFVEKSKLHAKEWLLYILCMEAGYTLEECASFLEISIVTSFHMRHKLESLTKKEIEVEENTQD